MKVTLGSLLNILGSGEFLRIGWRSKNGWEYYNRTIHIGDETPSCYKEAVVYSVYSVDATQDYESGIAIVLDDIGEDN